MKNALTSAKSEDLKRVGEIIGDIRVCMINTLDEGGRSISSRPMYVQEVAESGTLWFFTTSEGALIHQVTEESNVNVTFANAGKNKFLAASGHASQVMDRQKMEELWDPSLKAWFKDGLETPDICLLRIDLMDAEYWDSPSSPAVKIAGFLKAMVSEQPYRPGHHEKVQLNH